MNTRQKAFAEEYLNNGRNATKAYMTIYKPKSIKQAEANGARLIGNDKVQAYIAEQTQIQASESKFKKETYLAILHELAEARDARSIEAIKTIGKWQGFEAPQKLDVEGKITLKTFIQALESKIKDED